MQVQYLRGPLAARAGVGSDADIRGVGSRSLRALTTQSVRDAVAAHQGNVTAAARQLGISRTTLYKHLRG